jgi:hypothetical protein
MSESKQGHKPLPELSEYHKRFKTMHSSTLHAEFQKGPELFAEYHRVSAAN